MTIKARRTFDLPLVGNVSFTRTLRPGEEIFGKQNPVAIRQVTVLDEERTFAAEQYVDGCARVTTSYTDEGEDINKREILKGIKTRFGRVDVFWESPLLPSRARR